MRFTIIDCYTDEPSGLGVIPYIGTYPRYIYGAVKELKEECFYLTIDDLRATINGVKDIEKEIKTNVKVRNLSKNFINTEKIIESSDVIIVIAGIHTPGKYLSAYPGTTKEVAKLLGKVNVNGLKVLTGPAAYSGSGLYGGRKARSVETDLEHFDLIVKDLEYKLLELVKDQFNSDIDVKLNYNSLQKKTVLGAEVIKQYPHNSKFLISEIETMKGCSRKIGCSFCTEPLKCNSVQKRDVKDVIAEIKALNSYGMKNFRIGKQTCFYSYGDNPEIEKLLKNARKYSDVLHIDNVNPLFVNKEKTKSIVKHCTAGNIAAMGVESFDPDVVKKNKLNTSPELTYKAIKLINKYGSSRGDNGLPKFLPGLNLIFGLIGENKKTHQCNMEWLQKILDDNLLLRRINIREVVVFPGTQLFNECGDKFLKKNKKYYWKWRNEVRQKIDFPMLQKVFPVGTVMKNLRTEIYDGKTTFCRQIATYPLAVGVKGRLGLNKFVNIKVKNHMLRSLVGEKV
jgi:radical SAM superfamily enzyme with C-terminal helix-hairpin-helix motif